MILWTIVIQNIKTQAFYFNRLQLHLMERKEKKIANAIDSWKELELHCRLFPRFIFSLGTSWIQWHFHIVIVYLLFWRRLKTILNVWIAYYFLISIPISKTMPLFILITKPNIEQNSASVRGITISNKVSLFHTVSREHQLIFLISCNETSIFHKYI